MTHQMPSLAASRQVYATVNRNGQISRRDVLRSLPAAGLAAGAFSWTEHLAAESAALRSRGKACILLWMGGGPSQLETLDPKPQHENGGGTKAIATNVAGIRIAENLPQVAGVVDELAIIRSMTSKEGNHQRASYLLHTGYLPTPTVKYPALGAVVAKEIGTAAAELPSFVSIGPQRQLALAGGGYLGVEFDPFTLARADEPPANTTPTTDTERYQRRLSLLNRLEEGDAAHRDRQAIADHRKLYSQASRMILSQDMQAFDLNAENATTRAAYGKTAFGSGCLLARRLVESGVTFVEVSLGNWDTHYDNFDRTRSLTDQLDRPMAALIHDLKERGLLDSTLVVWMGEFGRTPRVNPRGGRDHFPRAFSAALAGCGVRGGQVVGKTDSAGSSVADRPITVPDLFRSVCQALEIDADKEYATPIGRPIKIAAEGEPVAELFS